MAAQFQLVGMQLGSGAIRVRVYDSPDGATFLYQWIISAADWITFLTGVGADATHAGTADVEYGLAISSMTTGKQAGQVGVQEGIS